MWIEPGIVQLALMPATDHEWEVIVSTCEMLGSAAHPLLTPDILFFTDRLMAPRSKGVERAAQRRPSLVQPSCFWFGNDHTAVQGVFRV